MTVKLNFYENEEIQEMNINDILYLLFKTSNYNNWNYFETELHWDFEKFLRDFQWSWIDLFSHLEINRFIRYELNDSTAVYYLYIPEDFKSRNVLVRSENISNYSIDFDKYDREIDYNEVAQKLLISAFCGSKKFRKSLKHYWDNCESNVWGE